MRAQCAAAPEPGKAPAPSCVPQAASGSYSTTKCASRQGSSCRHGTPTRRTGSSAPPWSRSPTEMPSARSSSCSAHRGAAWRRAVARGAPAARRARVSARARGPTRALDVVARRASLRGVAAVPPAAFALLPAFRCALLLVRPTAHEAAAAQPLSDDVHDALLLAGRRRRLHPSDQSGPGAAALDAGCASE